MSQRIRIAIIGAIAALGLLGCTQQPDSESGAMTESSSQAEATAAKQASTPAPARSAPPVESTRLTVTTAGLCQTLIDDLAAAQTQIDALIQNPDGSTVDVEELNNSIDTLEHDKSVAPAELNPKIEAVLEPLRTLEAIMTGEEGNQTIPFEDYRSAGIDLVTICESTI